MTLLASGVTFYLPAARCDLRSPSLRLPEALEDGSQTEVFLELPCHPWVGHLEVTLWFTGPCFSSSPESLILSLMTLFFKAHHSFHLRE